jgi:hypothetical protein
VLAQFLLQNVETPARVMDGVAVVITPHDAVLHTLNEVGTFIWSRADGRKTVAQIVDDVVTEFDISAESALRDAQGFVAQCVKLGLMHLSDSPQPIDLEIVLSGGKLG